MLHFRCDQCQIQLRALYNVRPFSIAMEYSMVRRYLLEIFIMIILFTEFGNPLSFLSRYLRFTIYM